MKESVVIKQQPLDGIFAALKQEFPFAGAETYCADLVDREVPLYHSQEELAALAGKLKSQGISRLHCSYWASPAAFLYGLGDVNALFGGPEGVKAYYSDLTGEHLFSRWAQEYALASAIGAEAYTFHLIDYFPIDGQWRFTITPKQVMDAMVAMTARFLETLEAKGLLTEASPRIELENAGWGLEYGAQTAGDFARVLREVPDPYGKLCVAWDVNHLLHAVGLREGKAVFMLPEDEISPAMNALQEKYGDDPGVFALKWIESMVLAPELAGKVACVQLADCVWKRHQYFTQGQFEEPWKSESDALPDWGAKEHYGEQMVLTHYDSHVSLGTGALDGKQVWGLLSRLDALHPDFTVLHELKNSTDLAADLRVQRAALQ